MLPIDLNSKTKRMKITVLMVLIFIALSCTETFEGNADFDPKIVVDVVFPANDTICVTLFSNQSIFSSMGNGTDYYYENGLDNAEVLLYENSVLCDTLEQGKYNCQYNSNTVAHEGAEYKLEVSHNDYPFATTITTMPFSVDVDTVRYAVSGDSATMNLYIDFEDRAGEENYYAIRIYKMIMGKRQARGFYNIDPVFGDNFEFDNSMMTMSSGRKTSFRVDFHDKEQDGLVMNIEILLPLKFEDVGAVNNINVGDTLQVCLFSVGKELWDFNNSQKIYEQTHASGAQPTMLYTNVENGVGLFTGYSDTVFSLVYE